MPGGKLSRLAGTKFISACNRRVRSVSAGRGEISSQQTGIMQSPPKVEENGF